jgi:hypothetical protein
VLDRFYRRGTIFHLAYNTMRDYQFGNNIRTTLLHDFKQLRHVYCGLNDVNVLHKTIDNLYNEQHWTT